jgi:hypothetical protein
MWSLIPVSTSDLLLIAINIISFYIIQILFFKHVGSKTNLNIVKETIDSLRSMILNLTYNKIDINDYISDLTQEEREVLKSVSKERNEYNSEILGTLYKIISGIFLFIIFMFFTLPETIIVPNGTNYANHKKLRDTFLTKTNMALMSITIGVFSTEFYLYYRYIGRMQMLTALDILEDPALYEKNLKKYNNYTLYEVYNDNEIQIIHEINKYINAPNVAIEKKPVFVDRVLKKIQSSIESDDKIQNLIKTKSKMGAQIGILKQNSKLINDTIGFDEFNIELKKLELFQGVVTADINDDVLNKIKKASVGVYNKITKC